MKKVKHIFPIFLQSFIPHDNYYPKLLHTRFQFSLKYYIAVLAFFSCVLMGLIVYQYSPKKLIEYKNSIVNTLSSYPEGTKITISHGVLNINQNKPLFLWVYNNNQPLFVFMVHEKDALDNSRIPLPFIFLGADRAQVVYKSYTRTFQYNPSYKLEITKDKVQELITLINSLFPSYLIGFYIALLVVIPLVFISMVTILMLFAAGVTFILLRAFIPHIHLKKCIQAGMHGTHIPLLLIVLLYTLCPASRNICIVSTSLIFVFTLVATFEMYSKEVTQNKVK